MFDRKEHWDRLYAEKSPLEVSWYQREPLLSLKLIQETGLDQQARIIDVGGGASVLVDYLLARSYQHVAVVDIAAKSLDHARQRLQGLAAQVEWIVTDITQFSPSHTFDLWHDRAVFHFLTDKQDQQKYVSVLRDTLPHNGHVIIATFAIGGPTRCSGLDIVQYDESRLMEVLGEEFILKDVRLETHLTPGGGEQLFSFFRLQRDS